MKLQELISLEPGSGTTNVIYRRNQGDEIFQKNQVLIQNFSAEKFRHRPMGTWRQPLQI